MKILLLSLLTLSSLASATEIRQVYQISPPLVTDMGDRITFSFEDTSGDRFYVGQCSPHYQGEAIVGFSGVIRRVYREEQQEADNLSALSYKGQTDFDKYIECKKISSVLAGSKKEHPAQIIINDVGIIEIVGVKD